MTVKKLSNAERLLLQRMERGGGIGTGPVGPAGPAGATGAPGAAGVAGTQGQAIFLLGDAPDPDPPFPGQQGPQGASITGSAGGTGPAAFFIMGDNPGDAEPTLNQPPGHSLVIESGIYTPTVTAVLNIVAGPTAGVFQWIRVGNVVTVSGRVLLQPTAATTTSELGISCPLTPGGLSGTDGVTGTAVRAIVNAPATVVADATNNRARLSWVNDTDTASRSWYLTFTYRLA